MEMLLVVVGVLILGLVLFNTMSISAKGGGFGMDAVKYGWVQIDSREDEGKLIRRWVLKRWPGDRSGQPVVELWDDGKLHLGSLYGELAVPLCNHSFYGFKEITQWLADYYDPNRTAD